MLEPTSTHAWTVFCDDVRQEVTGKMLFIGVYGSAALVEKFPHRQRLFIASTLVTPPAPESRDASFNLYLNEVVVLESKFVIPPESSFGELKEPIDKLPDGETPEKLGRIAMLTELGELNVEKASSLRARWTLAGRTYKAGVLQFRLQTKPSQPSSPSPESP